MDIPFGILDTGISHSRQSCVYSVLPRFASLLQEALDVRTYGQHMYFSYQQDLTRSLQGRLRQQAGKKQQHGRGNTIGGVQWGQLDKRFVFNRGLLKPLVGEYCT